MLPLNYVCTHRQTVCSVVSLQIWESGEYKVPAPGISFLSAVRSFFLSEIWSQAGFQRDMWGTQRCLCVIGPPGTHTNTKCEPSVIHIVMMVLPHLTFALV